MVKKAMKRRKLILILVMVVFAAAGGGLIYYALNDNESTKVAAINDGSESREKVVNLINKLKSLRAERDKEYNPKALSERYVELTNEIVSVQAELSDLEAKIYKEEKEIESQESVTVTKNKAPWIVTAGGIAGIIIGVLCFIALLFGRKEERKKEIKKSEDVK